MVCGGADVREAAHPSTSPMCVRGLQRVQAPLVQGLRAHGTWQRSTWRLQSPGLGDAEEI